MSLDGDLHALRDGRTSFASFARATAPTWARLAAYLMRRWVPPAGCSREDVEQELLLGVWRYLPRWQEGRGPTLARYVVWNACSDAKRWLHRQRGVPMHNPDREPGRFAWPASSLGRDEREAAKRFAAGLRAEPEQEAIAERRDAARRLAALYPAMRWQLAVAALGEAGGSVDRAAELLYRDCDARRLCRLGSRAQARTVVRRVAADLVRQVAA